MTRNNVTDPCFLAVMGKQESDTRIYRPVRDRYSNTRPFNQQSRLMVDDPPLTAETGRTELGVAADLGVV